MQRNINEQPTLVQAVFRQDYSEVYHLLKQEKSDGSISIVNEDCHSKVLLHAAAFCGDHRIGEILLSAGARVNARDNSWITPLHRACCSGSKEMVELLLNHDADVNLRDHLWQTPLHIAAANGSVPCASALLSRTDNPSITDRGGRTALHHAAYNGHLKMVQLLLSKGCMVNALDKLDRRPLHWAACNGHNNIVKLLLKSGADPNAIDKDGYTPLHAAAARGHYDAAKELIDAGAHVDAPSVQGNAPLHCACLGGYVTLASLLLSSKAALNSTNLKGQTPLHVACASTGGQECAKYLINSKANINAQALDGRTPLHMTAIHGRFMRSKILIDNGAIIDSTDRNGLTALHIAALNGHELLCGTLLSSGANPSLRGFRGRTLLHMCCIGGYVQCCRRFLQRGVDLNAQDDTGKTPLHIAAYRGKVDCLDLLVSSGADFRAEDNIRLTPLHYAAAKAHIDCVMALVGVGSSTKAGDSLGRTPLHLTCICDMYDDRIDAIVDTIEYLLEHRADPLAADVNGFTPIHYAATSSNNSKPMDLLLGALPKHFLLDGPDMPRITPLHLAAYHNHPAILQMLFPYFKNVNIQEENGRTPLALAAACGNFLCVQHLCTQHATVCVKDNIDGHTPVHKAALHGHHKVLQFLLECAGNLSIVNAKDHHGRTALMLAVEMGHEDCVTVLIQARANLDDVDENCLNAMFRAVVLKRRECVNLLVRACASIDRPKKFQTPKKNAVEEQKSKVLDLSGGKTALHLAAASPDFSCLLAVLNHKEAQNLVALLDDQGCTTLHWCCYNGRDQNLKELLKTWRYGLNIGNSFSPVHCAVYRGGERCLAYLADHFGSEAIRSLLDAKGRTPLHVAAVRGDPNCALALLSRHGASPNPKDHRQRTPLIAAARVGNAATLEILLDWKADVSAIDNEGATALHHACMQCNSECALLLLERMGEDPSQTAHIVNIRNRRGQTPLHLSAQNGLVDVTRRLLERGSSILVTDNYGLTPALACTPRSRVAHCLALILSSVGTFFGTECHHPLSENEMENFESDLKSHASFLRHLVHLQHQLRAKGNLSTAGLESIGDHQSGYESCNTNVFSGDECLCSPCSPGEEDDAIQSKNGVRNLSTLSRHSSDSDFY
ncbi:serine/threonine-protein phosphatase 6 regulatory ankyrin repeat subunit A-like [Ischnura elegans]|uniref:serine/threonine-protein phosphatase 6 regulatory ankyrin repeat subunit A-like n=1 Tax=Ischnura elegans TaxID=197161 RepID=UPI001ED89718|nr:serine/threonine-protein phosphatase 6 regulatory ankyrin repeat subunit A-like [Ischnura elegans]